MPIALVPSNKVSIELRRVLAYALALLHSRTPVVTPTPTPTPTPAPTFTAQPYIAGTTQVGQTLTGMDGTVTGGTVVSRRWLLGAAAVSTAKTCLATTIGMLTYEVTAKGDGGTTIASASVEIVAASTKPVMRKLGPIGINPDYTQKGDTGVGDPFLDRARTGRHWSGSGLTINSNGYPISISGTAEAYLNCPDAYDPDAPNTWVLECSKTDVGFYANYGDSEFLNFSNSTITPAGLRRIQYSVDPSKGTQGVGSYNLGINSLPTKFQCKADGDPVNDYIRIFPLKDEQELKTSGHTLTQQFVDRMKHFGGMRMMDWCQVNSLTLLSQEPVLTSWSWAVGTPIDVMIEAANRSDTPLWLNIPYATPIADAVALVVYARQKVAAHLPIYIEYANEVWNTAFAAYHAMFDRDTHGATPVQNVNTGWHVANLAAAAQEADEYSGRVRVVLPTQATAASTTEAIIVGMKQAMAEWADPTSPNPNAEYAARFKSVGSLTPLMAVSNYPMSGLDNDKISAADLAIVKSWPSLPDGGMSQLKQQLTTGGVISGTYQTISTVASDYAGQIAIKIREQIALIAYEYMPGIQNGNSDVRSIVTPMLFLPEFADCMAAGLTAHLNAGFDAIMCLTEIGKGNGTDSYALLANPYHLNTGRWLGAMQVQNNPPAPAQPHIAPTLSGTTTVGGVTTLTTKVTGGRGIYDVTFEGLPDGVVSDGFRTASGKVLATAIPGGEEEATFTITATATNRDDPTDTATCTQAITITKPIVVNARYARYSMTSNGGWIDTDAITLINTSAVEKNGTWTSFPTGNTTAANLAIAGDGVSYFVRGDQGGTADFGEDAWTQIAITRAANSDRVPLHTKVWLSETPFASDGSGGTLVLDLLEADHSKWAANPRRVFDIQSL